MQQLGLDAAKVELKLPTKEGYVKTYLVPHDIRSTKYKAQFSKKNSVISDPTQVELFKGTVSSAADDDFSRLAIIRDPASGKSKFSGLMRADGTFYRLSSEAADVPELEVKEVTTAELRQVIASCGIKHNPSTAKASAASSTLREGVSATLKQTQIATDADYEFFQMRGSGSNADILSILNAVDGIYRAELGVTLLVTFQNVWTTASDPYSSSDSAVLLGQFRSYWQSNFNSNKTYDVAHLWTGRDIDDSVVGIAYVGAVCTSARYGVSQYLGSSSLDVPLTAHELGHNFDADHDNCSGSTQYLMCPMLISNMNRFSPTSKASIAAYINSVSCLSNTDGGGGGGNAAPVLAPIGSKTVSEGSNISFSLSASDPEGQSLTYSASGVPSGASFVGTTFSYSPSLSTVSGGASQGQVTVTFTVTDSGGLSDSEAVVITVLNTNQPPVISNPGTKNVNEGAVLNYQVSASDPDSDSLRYSYTSALPPGAVMTSSGLFSWKPAGDQAGSYSVTLKVADPYGGQATATLNIVVGNVPGVASLPATHRRGDMDGNEAADLVLYRYSTGTWIWNQLGASNSGLSTLAYGLPGDIPIIDDFNGDRISDIAVFRPSNATWYLYYSGAGATSSYVFGLSTDVPTSGDFNGDGRADIAIYRPALGYYVYLSSADNTTHVSVAVGSVGDVPVPCDYDGDGKDDAATFSPLSGIWSIAKSSGGTISSLYGANGDIAVPADYDGNGSCDLAVWRPTTSQWFISPDQNSTLVMGEGSDVPVPADYLGLNTAQLATFDPRTGNWKVRQSNGSNTTHQLGLGSDQLPLVESYYYGMRSRALPARQALNGESAVASLYRRSRNTLYSINLTGTNTKKIVAKKGSYILRGDYDGDSALDTVVFNKGTWTFYTANGAVSTALWGQKDDIPVSGDFDGDARTDVAVYRPNNGAGVSEWYVIRSSNGSVGVYSWGLPGDKPMAADFDGDGWSDPAVWRESSGMWHVMDGRSGKALESVAWGFGGDIPLAADFDRDGKADKVVFRGGVGYWFVLYSGGGSAAVQWGQKGDIPTTGKFLNSSAVDFAVYRPKRRALYVRSLAGQQAERKVNVKDTFQLIGQAPQTAVK